MSGQADADRRHFLALAVPGLEDVTAHEIAALGGREIAPGRGRVAFAGSLDVGFRVALWTRTSSRLRLHLGRFRTPRAVRLAAAARSIEWRAYLSATTPFTVHASVRASAIGSSDLVRRVVGEAIAEAAAAQPLAPDAGAAQRLDVRINRDTCTIAIDLAGEGLDRRGYHLETGRAPLGEHLAAALLERCGWRPELPLVDPMCGSGTLPIEAALVALRIPPNRQRRFPFQQWPCFAADAWRRRLEEVDAAALKAPPAPIHAADRNAGQLGVTRRNAARAGVLDHLQLTRSDFADLRPPAAHGVLLVNPPFGRRVTEVRELAPLYDDLGRWLAAHWRRWRVGVLCADRELERRLDLPFAEAVSFRHGGLRCRLLLVAAAS